MRISTRILLGFGFVLVMLSLLAASKILEASRATGDLEDVARESELLADIVSLNRDVESLRRHSYAFTVNGHQSSVFLVERDDGRIETALVALKPRLARPEDREILEKLEVYRADLMEVFGRLVEDRHNRDSLYTETREIANGLLRSLMSREAARAFSRADFALLNYVEEPDSRFVRDMKRHLDTARRCLPTDATESLAAIDRYESRSLRMIQAIRGYLSLQNVVLTGLAVELSYNVDALRKNADAVARGTVDDVSSNAESAANWALGVSVAVVVAGLLVAWVVGRSIVNPLAAITATLTELAAGAQVDSVPGIDRVDEVGAMASAAQVFNEKNRETERLLESSRQASAELEDRTRDLARLNEELEQYAYVASHELQEPLRMVSTYVQLLAEDYGGQLGADADECINFASEGATRMQLLINDLLELTRVGTSDTTPVAVDLNATLDAVELDLEKSLKESRATIIRGDLPTVMGHANGLRQLVQNLISNAAKYRRPDVDPIIEVSASRSDAAWVLSVSDNGIGIAPEHAERIFRIFQRLHGRRRYEGSGMGLAIVKKIAEQHGGRVWVEPSSSGGSTFHVEIKDVA